MEFTLDEWRAEGTRRFGDDVMQWRFTCPSCGFVASTQDYKDAGAPATAVGYSCIGRYLDACQEMCSAPGPCNYAGGGLFQLNPVTVSFPNGFKTNFFAFADPNKEIKNG